MTRYYIVEKQACVVTWRYAVEAKDEAEALEICFIERRNMMDDFYSLENVNRRKFLRLFYVTYKMPSVRGIGNEWHHKEFRSRVKAIAFAQEVKGDVYAPSGAASWSYKYQE